MAWRRRLFRKKSSQKDQPEIDQGETVYEHSDQIVSPLGQKKRAVLQLSPVGGTVAVKDGILFHREQIGDSQSADDQSADNQSESPNSDNSDSEINVFKDEKFSDSDSQRSSSPSFTVDEYDHDHGFTGDSVPNSPEKSSSPFQRRGSAYGFDGQFSQQLNESESSSLISTRVMRKNDLKKYESSSSMNGFSDDGPLYLDSPVRDEYIDVDDTQANNGWPRKHSSDIYGFTDDLNVQSSKADSPDKAKTKEPQPIAVEDEFDEMSNPFADSLDGDDKHITSLSPMRHSLIFGFEPDIETELNSVVDYDNDTGDGHINEQNVVMLPSGKRLLRLTWDYGESSTDPVPGEENGLPRIGHAATLWDNEQPKIEESRELKSAMRTKDSKKSDSMVRFEIDGVVEMPGSELEEQVRARPRTPPPIMQEDEDVSIKQLQIHANAGRLTLVQFSRIALLLHEAASDPMVQMVRAKLSSPRTPELEQAHLLEVLIKVTQGLDSSTSES